MITPMLFFAMGFQLALNVVLAIWPDQHGRLRIFLPPTGGAVLILAIAQGREWGVL